MKKKKGPTASMRKDELQKQLKRKDSAVERMKRELKIEAALEDVRARALAMHQSEELKDVVAIVFDKFRELNLQADGGTFIAIFNDKNKDIDYWTANPTWISPTLFRIPDHDHTVNNDMWAARKNRSDFLSNTYSRKLKNSWWNYLLKHTDLKNLPEDNKKMILESDGMTSAVALSKNSGIGALTFLEKPFSKQEIDIVKRFAKVFEQAYIRFLDLQKAEVQACEAQIEVALERVRSRTMAMQKTEELNDVIKLIYEQLVHLGLEMSSAGFVIDYKETNDINLLAFAQSQEAPVKVHIPYIDHPICKLFIEAKEKELDFYPVKLTKEEKDTWFKHIFEQIAGITEEQKQFVYSLPGYADSHVLTKNVILYIQNYTGIPYTDAENAVLMRFGKVFEQTYTRFTDLKQAEAQTRESQIQLALERVRARTMAMHRSDELHEVADVLFHQLLSFGGNILNAGFALCRLDADDDEYWVSSDSGIRPVIYIPHTDEPLQKKLYEGWKNKAEFYSESKGGAELKAHYDYLVSVPSLKPFFDESLPSNRSFPTWQKWHAAYFSHGYLFMLTLEEYDDEKILIRFAKVFEQTYTRFLDLQKAEMQAREAQIETSLERVRSKTMAMHSTNDVGDTVATMFDEFVRLGILTNRCGILIFSDEPVAEVWTAKSNPGRKANLIIGKLDMIVHPLLQGIHEAWKKKESFYTYTMEGNDLRNYYQALNDLEYYPVKFDMNALPSKEFHSDFYFPEGSVFAFTAEPIHDEESRVIKRFAGVFGQTYRRYLDLQKAEAQAREAQIELSLERVRAKTMAMHNSQDVGDTVAAMFDELVKLGIDKTTRSGVAIIGEKDDMEIWTASSHANGEIGLDIGRVDLNIHPLIEGFRDAWRSKKPDYFYELIGEDLKDYFEAINASPDYPTQFDLASLPSKQIHSSFFFPEGAIYAFSLEPLTAEVSKIFKRFAGVFGQTYRRYLDLKKAEAQARSAQIEAAMEKVRARSLAMQKPEELIEVAEVLRKEMGSLGVEELETSSIYIVDEEKQTAECWYAIKDVREGDSKLVSDHMIINLHDTWVGREMQKFYSSGEKQISILMQGKNRKEWINYCAAHSKVLQGYYGEEIPERIYHLVKFSNGYMGAASPGNISAESWDLLQRATSVFSFAYTRFLDLHKAEAQTREAQIELALERVRARTMAMFKSDELAETAAILIGQLNVLGIEPISLYIGIIKDKTGDMEIWSTDENGKEIDKRYVANIHKNISIKKMYDLWIAKEKSVALDMQGDELENWLTYWRQEHQLEFSHKEFFHRRVQNIAYFSKGFIAFTSSDLQPKETFQLLERFAAVFNLTYTRFLDLQKAEAQAREAQIEIGLERVRSRAMAMHKTDELLDAAELVYKELSALGVASMSINYAFVDDEEKNASYYSINPVDGKIPPFPFIFPHTETDVMRTILAGWKKQEPFNLIELDEGATLKHQTYIGEIVEATMIKNNIDIPFSLETFLAISPKRAVIYTFNFSKGYLFIIGSARLTKPQEEMVLRFTKVFEMTYRRFLDLKQAEAQAREAKIEAALERVRSKAMAMHSSKDLTDTIIAFYRELESLSVTPRRCGVGLINKETHIAEISSMNTTEQGDSIAVIGNLDLKVHPILKGIYDSWLSQKDYFPVLRGLEIKEYYQILTPQINYPDYPNDVVQYGYFFFFAEGGVYAWTEKQMTENELKIYKRFTSVLTLTYKRYKDLKQAEEQAREATIEAALERVRGKAMAMRNSDDLSSAASMVFTELRKLGIHPIRSGVGIISKESRQVQFYSAMSSPNGDSLALTGGVIMSGHPEFEKQYDSWLRKENHFIVLKGEELKSYYKFLFAGLNIDSEINIENDQGQYGHWLMFSEGFLFAWSDKAYSETEINILDRFKKIVELTFRRYIELQKSEINAREAVKQAALDRVRADIASMRTTNDLEKITPLIWNELTILGIPFIRCGVFIMDEEQELIHTFLSTPDGKAIAAFHIPYNTPGNINQVLNHWQQKENYIDHWDEKAFTDFADTLVKQGALASPEQYLKTIPHGGFHLHFLPFLQGMLYVGNSARLGEEEINLIQSVADAFSTAYARYEDFNKLEAAKQTVEKTLVDLKQAQQQLVQSEKMASLGELTAGIAHEIQNPLNFVNNFSEVNTELIDEAGQEIDKGNISEVKIILNDIKENEQKINHHGKRADAIVKGMLQHSRSSTGVKEPTNINALADEYLRLAYHGLRAKDNSFNATMKADFDESIGKINIIPQDIGRVLLNLYNNAFYAVAEKKKQRPENYDPTVSVSTKKIDNQICISVSDNGNGIPQRIVDKIFQPFFTTKPTGQGTGLGLSLSYDTIKAHGGEIKVETKEGEGSMFIIELPILV